VLERGSKKSEQLRNYLSKQTAATAATKAESLSDDSLDVGLRKALEHKDRLLEYDKTRYCNCNTNTNNLLILQNLYDALSKQSSAKGARQLKIEKKNH